MRPDEMTLWDAELARFQIDEVNGLFDRLQDQADPAYARYLGEARARIASFRTVAPWWPSTFDGFVRLFLRERRFVQPEDAFGAAVLLLCREPSSQEVWALVKDLGDDVGRTLALLDLWREPVALPG